MQTHCWELVVSIDCKLEDSAFWSILVIRPSWPSESLRHPWLDPNDEANTVNGTGFWVPSPTQIQKTIEDLKSGRIKIATAQSLDQRQLRRMRKLESIANEQVDLVGFEKAG